MMQIPHGKKAIGCRWVFKIKRSPDGSLDRYKGRLIAKGFSQNPGVDYVETFAPTSRIASSRIILDEAHKRGWKVRQIDFMIPLLNGAIDAELTS
jgi:hypothetical protein